MRKIRPLRIIVIAGVILALCVAAIYGFVELQFSAINREIASDQAWILYHVNHARLATEARNFAKERRSRGFSFEVLTSDNPDVPASLAVLKPRSIETLDGYVKLEFGGHLLHYGIVVYDEGLEGPGTKKLAEGVWFYSENGRYPGRDGEKRKGPPSGG